MNRIPTAAVLAAAAVSGAAGAANELSPVVKATAQVTQAQAQAIALEQVPGGTIKGAELENPGGQLSWSVDVARKDARLIEKFRIDARTAAILEAREEPAPYEWRQPPPPPPFGSKR